MVLNCIQCPIHCENSKKYKNDIERYKKEIENYKKDTELSDKKLLEMLQENQVLKDQVYQKAQLIHKYATNISKSRKELIMKPQVKLLRAVSQVEKHQSIIEGDVLTMRVAIQGIKQNCDNCKETLEKEREDIKKKQEDLLNRNINLEHICSQQQHKVSFLEKEVNRLESILKIPNTKKSANTSDSLSSFPPTPTPSNSSSDESCDLSPHLSGSLESVFAIPHGIEQAGIVKTCSNGKVDMSNYLDLKGAPEPPVIIPLQAKDKVCPDNKCNISYLDSSMASNEVNKEKGKKPPKWEQILLAKKPRQTRKLDREKNWVKTEPSSEERSRLKGEDENACKREDNITDGRMVVSLVTRKNTSPPIAKYCDVKESPVPCNAMTDSLTLGVEVKEEENKAQNNDSSLGQSREKNEHSSLQVKPYEPFKQPSTPGYSPKLNDFESICKFLHPHELIEPIDQNKDALQFQCAKGTSNQIIDKVSTKDTATTAVNKNNCIESYYNPLNVQPKISKSIFSPVSLTESCSDYRDKTNKCITNQPASENLRQVVPDPALVERKPITHSENSPSRQNMPSLIIEPLEKDINTAATVEQPEIAKKTEADHDLLLNKELNEIAQNIEENHDSSSNHFESEELSDVEIPDKIMNSVLAEDLNISELSCIENLGDSSIDESDLNHELSDTVTDTNYVSNTIPEKNSEFPMKVVGFPILSHETGLKNEKVPQNLEANEKSFNIDDHTDFTKHNNSHQSTIGTMQANSVEIPIIPLNDEQSNADLSQSVQNQYLNSILSQRSPTSQNHYFMRNIQLPNYSGKKINVNQSKSNNKEPNRQKSPSPTPLNCSSSVSPYKTPEPLPPSNSEHQLSPKRSANDSPPHPRSPGSLNHYSMRTLSPTSYCGSPSEHQLSPKRSANDSPPHPRSPGSINHYSMRTLSPTSYCGSPNRSPRAQCKSPRSPSSPPPLAIHYRGYMRNVKHNEDDCTCNQFSSLVKCSRHTAIENFFTSREKRGLPMIEEVNEVISVPINEQLSISITDSTGPKEYNRDSICDFNALPTLLLANELNEPKIPSEKASIVKKSTSSLTSGTSCTPQGVKMPCLRQVTKTYSSNRAERTQKKQFDQNSVDNFCSWKFKNIDCLSAELTNIDDESSITITDTTFNENDIFPLISNKLISFHSCLQRYRFRPMRTKPFLNKAALRRNILAPRNNSSKPFCCKRSTKPTDLIRPYVNRLKQLLLLDKVNSTDSRDSEKLNGEEQVSCSDEIHSVGLNHPIVTTDTEMPKNVDKEASLAVIERHKQLNEVQEVPFSDKKLHANDRTSLNPYDTALTLLNTCEHLKGEQLKSTNIRQPRQISSGLVESKLNSNVTDIEMTYHVSLNKGMSLSASNQNKELKDAQNVPSSDEKLKSSFGAFTIPRVDLGCMSLDQTQIFCGTELNKLNRLETINKTNIINHKMSDHVSKTTINLIQEDNEIGAVHGTSFSEKRNPSDLACHISNTDLSCVDFYKSKTDHEDFNNCQTVTGSEIFDEEMPDVSDCKKTKLVLSDDDMSMFNRNKPSITYQNSSQYNLDFQALNHCLTEDHLPVIKENKKISKYERNNKKIKNEPNNQKVLKSFSKLEHNKEINTEQRLDKIKPINSYNQVGSIEKQYHHYQNSLPCNKPKAENHSVESMSRHTDLELLQLEELDKSDTVNKHVMNASNHKNAATAHSIDLETNINEEIPDVSKCRKGKLALCDDHISLHNSNELSISKGNISPRNLNIQTVITEKQLPVAKEKKRVSRYERNNTNNELNDQKFLKFSPNKHDNEIKTEKTNLDKLKSICSYTKVASNEKQNYHCQNSLAYNKLRAEYDSVESLSKHTDLESTQLKELDMEATVHKDFMNVLNQQNVSSPASVNSDTKIYKEIPDISEFIQAKSALSDDDISLCNKLSITNGDTSRCNLDFHAANYCLPEEQLPVVKGKRRVSRYERNNTKNELSDQTFFKSSPKDEHNTKIKTIQKLLSNSVKSLSSHADLESTKLKELNQSDPVIAEVMNVPISVNSEKTCNDVSKCMKRAGHVNNFNGKDSKTINGLSLKKSHISICKAMTLFKNDHHKVSEIINESAKRKNYKKMETKNVSAPIDSITDVSKSANRSTLQHSINDSSISVNRNTYVQTQNNKPMKCLHEKRQMLPSPSSSSMGIQKDQLNTIQEVAVRSEDGYVMLNPIDAKIAIPIATRQYQNRRKLSTTLSKSLDTKLPKNLDQCNSFKYGKTEPCNNQRLRPNNNLKNEEKSESQRIKTLEGNQLMERFRTLDKNSPINKHRTAVSTCQTSSHLQCKRKSVPEVSISKSPGHPKKICLIEPLPLNQSKRQLNYGLETSCMKQLPIHRNTSIQSSLSCSKIELRKTGKVCDLFGIENNGKQKTDQVIRIAEKVVPIPEENKPSASGTEEMVTGYESIKQCLRVKVNAKELTNTKPKSTPIVENSCARETTDIHFDDDYDSDDGLIIDFKNDSEIPNGAKYNPQTLFNVESKYKGEINIDYCPRNTSLTPSNGQPKIIPKVEVFPKGEIKFNQEHVDWSFPTTSSLNIVQPDNEEKCGLESPRLESSDISSFMPKFYTEQRDEVASGVTKTDKKEDLNMEGSMHEYIAKLKYTRKELNELIPKGDKITVNGNIIRAAMKVHSGSIKKYAEKNISEKRKTTPKLQQGGHKPGHMDEVLKVLRLFVREPSSSMVKIKKTADELKNYEIHILLSGLLRTLEEEVTLAFCKGDNNADMQKELKRASWINNVTNFADILPTHKKGTPLLHPRLKTFVALLVLIKESLPAERKMNFFSEVLGHFESYFLKYKPDEGGKLEHPTGVMTCVAMLYGTMARLEGAMCRVRRMLYDLFYCTTKLAHTLSYALLIVWPDILPRKPIETYYDDPLGLVLVHALTTCPLVNSELAPKHKRHCKSSPASLIFERLLKHLALRYGFTGGTTSANHIFALFAAQLDREFVHEAIVLLCKRRGLDWFKHWPLGTLLNMLRRWHQGSGVTDVVAAAIVKIFGSVVRSFDGKTTEDLQTLFELLKEILSDGTSPHWMQELVIVNLCQMSRFNKGLCWGLVASWRPLEPVSADVIDKILLEIVSRCPKKFWLVDNRSVIYLK